MSYNLTVFLGTLIISYIYTSLLPSKLLHEKKYLHLSSVFYSFIVTIVIYITNNFCSVAETIIMIIINFLIIRFGYKIGNIISLIVSTISYLVVFICGEISEIFFTYLLNVDLIYIEYYPEHVIQIYAFIFALSLFLCFFIRPKNLFDEIKQYSFERENVKIVGIQVLIFIVMLAFIIYLLRTERLFSPRYNFGIMLLSVYIVLSFVYLLQIRLLVKSKNDYDSIYNYIVNVEKIAGQLKKQEHEHNNQLIAIKSLAEDNKNDELILFIDKIIKNKINNKISANVGLDNINDNLVKTLLMHKLNSAVEMGVRTETFVRSKIPILNISPKDITNIIGIVMDNAIEGAMNSEGKYISILIDQDEDNLETNITIANTYKEPPEIYENGVSTKGKYRGNGLSILAEIENDNDNVKINTELTDELFIQDIFIKR